VVVYIFGVPNIKESAAALISKAIIADARSYEILAFPTVSMMGNSLQIIGHTVGSNKHGACDSFATLYNRGN